MEKGELKNYVLLVGATDARMKALVQDAEYRDNLVHLFQESQIAEVILVYYIYQELFLDKKLWKKTRTPQERSAIKLYVECGMGTDQPDTAKTSRYYIKMCLESESVQQMQEGIWNLSTLDVLLFFRELHKHNRIKVLDAAVNTEYMREIDKLIRKKRNSRKKAKDSLMKFLKNQFAELVVKQDPVDVNPLKKYIVVLSAEDICEILHSFHNQRIACEVVNMSCTVMTTSEKQDILEEYVGLYANAVAYRDIAQIAIESKTSMGKFEDSLYSKIRNWMLTTTDAEQVCDAIEATQMLGRLGDLETDSHFWMNIHDENVIYHFVKGYLMQYGGDETLNFMFKNMVIAKIYEDDGAVRSWIAVFSKLVNHLEKERIARFVRKVQKDSYLGESVAFSLLQELVHQSNDNYKRLQLEQTRVREARADFTNQMLKELEESLERLESSLAGFKISPCDSAEIIRTCMERVVELRECLKEVGINPVIDVDDWLEGRTVPYNNKLHTCVNKVTNEENVIPLSMGVSGKSTSRIYKANVKKTRGK